MRNTVHALKFIPALFFNLPLQGLLCVLALVVSAVVGANMAAKNTQITISDAKDCQYLSDKSDADNLVFTCKRK